jgi:hypothetical protein
VLWQAGRSYFAPRRWCSCQGTEPPTHRRSIGGALRDGKRAAVGPPGIDYRPRRIMVLFLVKLFHTVIFLVLSVSILFLLYCAIFNRRTKWTAVALVLVVIEGIVIVVNAWRCPLADLAEHIGADEGSVSSIFLPDWLAGRVFHICTPLASMAILVLGFRLALDRGWFRRLREKRE